MAPVKDSNTPLPRSYIEEYWTLVRKSLENIFSKPPNEANALQHTIENLPIAKQDFFYNTEPLHVAADLAGENPTDSQIKVYLWLRTVEDLKQILQDYDYLEYDDTLLTSGLLQVNVTSDATRNVQIITDICHKLEEATSRTYFFTYGGNYSGKDNVEEVWSFFTLKEEVDFNQHAEIQSVYEIIKDAPLPTFQINQVAA